MLRSVIKEGSYLGRKILAVPEKRHNPVTLGFGRSLACGEAELKRKKRNDNTCNNSNR